jgi:adenylate cyclase
MLKCQLSSEENLDGLRNPKLSRTLDNSSKTTDGASFEFKAANAGRIFDYLVGAFTLDYMIKKLPHLDSGWRSLGEIAKDLQISASMIYAKKRNQLSSPVKELVGRGLVERRFFQNERGRSGEVMRLRAAYENEIIKSYVEARIRKGRKIEPAPRPKLDRLRLAVLPFANLSSDPGNEYFADGMTEELISTLSKISGLKVIARTSVMRYKYEKEKNIEVIRDELGVGSILEGSVRKSGDRLRITAQLIDSAKSEHLWSQSYDRDLKDVFEIQSDISESVAQELKVKLLTIEKTSMEKEPTKNAEAHTLYLRGRYYLSERTEEKVRKALTYFERAVSLDPAFALAYCGIADSYSVLSDYGWMSAEKADPLAKEYSLKALRIDDGLSEAHASYGFALYRGWEFRSSEKELKKAMKLRPSYAATHHWYALLLQAMERVEESYQQEKLALEIDPYSRIVNMGLGNSLYFLEKYDEAMQVYDQLVELNPDFAAGHAWKAQAHVMRGEFDAAILEIRKAFELDRKPAIEEDLAWVLAVAGKKEEAERVLDHVMKTASKEQVSPLTIGQAKLALGEYQEGFDWLNKAIDERDTQARGFRNDPWFKQFNSDPRWKQIEQKMRQQW